MGVVARIVMTTVEGSEVEDIGSTMVESLLLVDHSSLADYMVPFKVTSQCC